MAKYRTTSQLSPIAKQSSGMALIMVLVVIAIVLAMVYAMSRTSATQLTASMHEEVGVRVNSAAQTAANQAIENFAADPNWMPYPNPINGTLPTGEPYTVDVQLSDNGAGRSIGTVAQMVEPQGGRTLAEQLLTIRLARQRRDNFPASAIAALATPVNSSVEPTVYVANGTTIRGNIRSKGPIHFQQGFVLQGLTYVLGDIATDGTGPERYLTYRTSWGGAYQAEELASRGTLDSTGQLRLTNLTLGVSAANPMGVYYHEGSVLLDHKVHLTGTLVVKGNLRVSGTEVHLFAVDQAIDPTTGITFKSSFPVIVVDGSIVFDSTADWVRISGLVLASQNFRRVKGTSAVAEYSPGHQLPHAPQLFVYTITGALFDSVQSGKTIRDANQIVLACADSLLVASILVTQSGPRDQLTDGLKELRRQVKALRKETKSIQDMPQDVINALRKELQQSFSALRKEINSIPDMPQDVINALRQELQQIWTDLRQARDITDIARIVDQIEDLTQRITGKNKYSCGHDHSLTIDAIPDPFGTADGPAIYIKGAIMANRVWLEHRADPDGRPFALVFDAARTDTTDAPGFFTWRTAEWTEAN